ncbi:FtsX-like permease family protein [uncultured Draconibacterium sp.]|uniref:ABC transporter permease n=1 Tax=uncultured Draconibacterium sp. TaxID=1573823 RepID=UPI0029C78F95|nr:FtsX-like permease family protein [uncultured Draconibacterium sp.]
MILSIAWRNVWRSRTRSIVMIAAIALGLFAGIFMMAFMNGMYNSRIESATKSELSHIQVHAPHFLDNTESELFISDGFELAKQIEALDSVEAASPRLIAEPFIMAAHGTGGGKMLGIDPEKEKQVTDIWEHVIDGTYLEKTSRMPPVLVGKKMADKLRLKVGTKINVQLVDFNGDLSSKGYRVAGIYKTVNTGFDEMHLFVNINDLRTQIGIQPDAVHEIAILLKNNSYAQPVKPSVQKIAAGMDVQTWKEISPEMSIITDSLDQYMYIFILIILIALCFGIINTMLMAVLERVKEIGMLMAVGMNKRKIFSMIILESIMLTLTGGVVGIIMGIGISRIFENHPINLSAFAQGLEQYGMSTEIATVFPSHSLGILITLVVLTGLISAIYPARKALKLNPAEATRTD